MPRIDLNKPKPSKFQRMQVSTMGYVKIGSYMLDGWKQAREFYLFLCKKHGYVTNHNQGYGGNLVCPKCFKEDSKK